MVIFKIWLLNFESRAAQQLGEWKIKDTDQDSLSLKYSFKCLLKDFDSALFIDIAVTSHLSKANSWHLIIWLHTKFCFLTYILIIHEW